MTRRDVRLGRLWPALWQLLLEDPLDGGAANRDPELPEFANDLGQAPPVGVDHVDDELA
ncbi:MAG: hypothetical protein JKY65_27015 [Planctomycetes bacterium]|nr:hypothetical protein [Planctomycetota bacterium]